MIRRKLYELSSIATSQRACDKLHVGGFDGHHLAAKYRQNNCMTCMSKSPELVIRQKKGRSYLINVPHYVCYFKFSIIK